MAEFSEVIRQFNRRCKEGCANCPMMEVGDNCWDYAIKDPAAFEQRVMEWAKAHPEPVYPRWADWLDAMGYGLYYHIPADIAEKLGIKPKEG